MLHPILRVALLVDDGLTNDSNALFVRSQFRRPFSFVVPFDETLRETSNTHDAGPRRSEPEPEPEPVRSRQHRLLPIHLPHDGARILVGLVDYAVLAAGEVAEQGGGMGEAGGGDELEPFAACGLVGRFGCG